MHELPTFAGPLSLLDLGDELRTLRDELRAAATAAEPRIARLPEDRRPSARNLVRYLALRRHDRRDLQRRLARHGLSSLGRCEGHVLASVEAVLSVVERLEHREPAPGDPTGIDVDAAEALLRARADALLGAPAAGRDVRIMVTLPSEAATDPALVDALVDGGMDCARINCAHDAPEAWAAMAAHVRAAAQRRGRPCRVLMDVGGPKLRTGALPPAEAVLKLRPHRDVFGRVQAPWRAWLGSAPAPAALPAIELDGAPPAAGATLRLTDARGAQRRCIVERAGVGGVVVAGERTAYVVPGTELRDDDGVAHAVVAVPERAGHVRLQAGDLLHVIAPGAAPPEDVAWVPCSLPQVFADVRPGHAVVFDDGRIGGRVVEVDADRLVVRIRHAAPGGARLRADKGINLPDSNLHLPALTAEDREAIPFVARHADLLGLSFVHRDGDIAQARALLDAAGGADVGLVLKIETPRAFRRLPELLLAAMALPGPWGVMIARGDLAVECGFERLAEVQEEILWLCEAAHTPAIWATQVLEGMAKTGLASRAEITDAAMGVRAECVMLNKGPSIVEAMETLDDVLCRMVAHQHKKTALLRRLAPFSAG